MGHQRRGCHWTSVRMKLFSLRFFLLLLLPSVGGCQHKPSLSETTYSDPDADIKFNLASLESEDQEIAEQQRYCPIMESVRLGEMGRPFKVTVKGVTAFVCCENCVQLVQEEPDRALAKISRLLQTKANELAPRAP